MYLAPVCAAVIYSPQMKHARSTRYDQHLALRLGTTLLDRVRQLARARDQRVSEVCRAAIHEHVAAAERRGGGGGADAKRSS